MTSTENKPLPHYQSANDSSKNAVYDTTNARPYFTKNNPYIAVTTCNGSILKSKDSKQINHKSANDFLNNADNDIESKMKNVMVIFQRTKTRNKHMRNWQTILRKMRKMMAQMCFHLL